MINWFDIIQPHVDIRRGHFDEAVFAADLGDVYRGNAPDSYNDPYIFFKKTYLTVGLKGLLGRVHEKLRDGVGSAVVQIQTPFGGGKTHSLVTLYHYLKHGQQVKALLPAELGLLQPKISVIAGNHWNPVEGRTTEGITRYTFWGEIAYQIGGAAGYEQFRANDEARISPGKEKLRDFLQAHQPFMLLFDEILEYVNRALDQRSSVDVSLGTQTFSFFQELTESVSSLSHGMLVITLPSSNLEDFGEKEEESLARLGKIFGRVESIETPVRGQEIYAVIRRRLFEEETLKEEQMREVIHHYFELYRVNRDDLPVKVRDIGYRNKMELAYPFHPDLIDILYEKWSTFSLFQRTRGVLRLLANIIEELYQREANLNLILPGDINLEQSSIRQEFLKHIGSQYEGIIASDIAGHEAKAQALDASNHQWKHLGQRIATAIFFHSFSADDTQRGINLPYIKLAVMRHNTVPSMVTEVLQKEANQLWYLNTRIDTYYFSRIPNLNRMILDKKELYNHTYEDELELIIKKETGKYNLRPYIWPDASRGDGVPDNRELKLLILHPDERDKQIPTWIERRGSSFREYQNTLFFAIPNLSAFANLREDVKTSLALHEIEREIKRDPNSPLAASLSEIKQRIHRIERDYSYKVRLMYDTIQVGTRKLPLGKPIAGNETLTRWYWQQLIKRELIVQSLHYRLVLKRIMLKHEQLATSPILEQFYKNTRLPTPVSPDVVTRALQLGIKEGVFGFIRSHDGQQPIRIEQLHYRKELSLSAITFDNGSYLLSQATCEAILAEDNARQAEEAARQQAEQANNVAKTGKNFASDGKKGPDKVPNPSPPIISPPIAPVKAKPSKYKRLRLVVSDIPASRLIDISRGILTPLSNKTDGELKFTLELDVTSQDGISRDMVETKIKETIRQIGARLVEEEVG